MTTPRSLRVALILFTVAAGLVLAPRLSLAQGAPKTLAADRALGDLSGSSAVVDSPFPIGYLGVSWVSGPNPAVRFRAASGRWSAWITLEEDEIPGAGRTFSSLVPASGAMAYQVRGSNRGVRGVVINTTDGTRTRSISTSPTEAQASVAQPAVISRAQWGADESFRFNADGTEKWPPAFYATKKLIVHHTDTQNADPDPAATVRAIYYYHAITQGWGDIGYNFLIDAQGHIYKGRYSGPAGTLDQDTLAGENGQGFGVTGAHTSGWNSGTSGVAILGTYTSTAIPAAARSALVDHLAWEADHNGIDPLGTSTFINPVSGATKTTANISGHRDWVATECPGQTLYDALPSIRQDVAARIAPSAPPSQTKSYAPSSTVISRGTTSDPVSALAADDGFYYHVASVKAGRKQAVDWYGKAQLDVAGVTKLTLTYQGSESSSVSQTLSAYDFGASTWRQIASATVSTTEQTFTWTTANPASYISSTGEVRLRVSGSSPYRFTAAGDLMQFTVQY